MNACNFKKLIEAVERQPDKLFDMCTWANDTDCGTAACAVGCYCLANPDATLSLRKPLDGYYAGEVRHRSGLRGTDAAAREFDISEDDAEHFFLAEEYNFPSRDNVLTRLCEFYVANGGVL